MFGALKESPARHTRPKKQAPLRSIDSGAIQNKAISLQPVKLKKIILLQLGQISGVTKE